MFSISNFYKIFQALSLDIVLGAVMFSYAISLYFQSPVSYSALTCLAIAVWLIYTIDHLLDAKKTGNASAAFRHRFHQQYKKPITVFVVLLVVAGMAIACVLPRIILYNGLTGVLLTVIYFMLLQNKWFWQKEICIATGYTWGICLAPVCINWGQLSVVQLLFIPQVFLLVFANLLIFSWFDMSNDKQDGHQSMVIRWGEKRARIGIILIIIAGVLLSLFTMLTPFFGENSPLSFGEGQGVRLMEATLLLMFGTLWLIFKHHTFFRKNDMYRVIGDGIFFIPVLFILYARQH
jgi:4-hydroxybenzoate polyprenyltransferase